MANANKSLNNFFSKNQFIGSFNLITEIPTLNDVSECCFIGRSNVGKSSLINAILFIIVVFNYILYKY